MLVKFQDSGGNAQEITVDSVQEGQNGVFLQSDGQHVGYIVYENFFEALPEQAEEKSK